MPGTTSTALPFFSHDQHHTTDAAKRKGGGIQQLIIISKCHWFGTNSSSLTWSCTAFNVNILCIVLLEVRVVRFSGQLSCTVSCLIRTLVSIEAAWVNSRSTAALVVFYSQLLKPFTCVVLRHWLLHDSIKSLLIFLVF